MQRVAEEIKARVDGLDAVRFHVYSEEEELPLAILSAEYRAAGGGELAFAIGGAAAAKLQLALAESAQSIEGLSLRATWELDGVEMPLISGTADNGKTAGGGGTVNIYDALYSKGTAGYAPAEEHFSEVTADVIWAEIAEQLGAVPNSGTMEALAAVPLPEGVASMNAMTTLAQAAGTIAALIGCNAIISRAGELTAVPPTRTDYQLEPYDGGDDADSAPYAPSGLLFRKIETVSIETDEGTQQVEQTTEYPAGDEGERIVCENILADQDAANRAWAALEGLRFCAGTYSIPGGLLLEPGDILELITLDGVIPVLVTQINIKWDGGVMAEIVSVGAEMHQGYTGPVNKRYKELDQKVYNLQTSVNGLISEAASVKGELTRIVQDTEGIIAEALKSYATGEDVEAIRQEISSRLAVLSDRVQIVVRESETAMNELQAQIKQIRASYDFTADGLYIGLEGNDGRMRLFNDIVQILLGDEAVAEMSHRGTKTSTLTTSVINIGPYQIRYNSNGHLTIT